MKRFHYEKAALVAKRRANRSALPAHLPRIETVVISKAHLPVLLGHTASYRRERGRAPRHRTAQFRLLQVRRPKYARRSSEDALRQACASAGDRGWHTDRGNGRPRDGLQVCRSPAALSPGPDLSPSGVRARPLTLAGLAGARGLPAAACPRADASRAEASPNC